MEVYYLCQPNTYVIARETAEAEYVALENAAQEVIWMKQLMVVYEDNQAAVCIAQNPQII